MGKYTPYSAKKQPQAKPGPHPIWRGVGFALMVIIPIISYAAARLLLDANTTNHWFPLPTDLILHKFKYPMLLIEIVTTLVFIFVLSAIFMLITFLLNSLFGAPRYGPQDVPPVAYRRRKK